MRFGYSERFGYERSNVSSPVRCNHCNTITCNPAAYVKHKCKTVQVKSSEKCRNGKLQHGFDDLSFMEFSSHKCPFVAKVQCEQRITHPSSAFEIFDCKVCSRVFPREQALNSHRKCRESKIITYCDTCERDFESTESLQIHELNLRSVESCPSPTFQRDEVMQASQNDVHNGKEHFLPLLNLKTSESVLTKGNSEAFISRTSEASLFSAAVIFAFYFRKMKMSQLSQLALIVHQRYQASKMTNCATPDFESPGRLQTHIPSREEMSCASGIQVVPIADEHEMHGRKIRYLQFQKESALIQHSRIHKSHVQRRPTHSCNICSYASVHQSTFLVHL
ncbi:ras-responsive element-binding protein 1 [Caerostris darwini]|uniref:Ras-responsive element-binding protein 1 n=1 Tax=Caerostris darwini TaxID=1538125 RepID=A0AAV4MNA4_9ARAC|nr:ras-responsive element-binding protein 1 [Caerostris darwini]